MTRTVVIAKCVACGHEQEVGPGEVGKGELPMCEKCYSPMFAKSASAALDSDTEGES